MGRRKWGGSVGRRKWGGSVGRRKWGGSSVVLLEYIKGWKGNKG